MTDRGDWAVSKVAGVDLTRPTLLRVRTSEERRQGGKVMRRHRDPDRDTQAQADAIKAKEAASVIAKIKVTIEKYQLTAAYFGCSVPEARQREHLRRCRRRAGSEHR